MIAVEHQVQKIRPGKWAELEEIEKKYAAIEARYGFPPKQRYQCIIGGPNTNDLIFQRQWDSLAAMEATYEKIMSDPEYQALGAEVITIVESQQIDVYTPLP